MPKREDIKCVMVIGSGPIVIGQACEFDYSGTQGVKALREEGYRVVLVNSNPATIMTDPEIADRTYVEPLTVEVLTSIIERERPDAILPTLGGQTALNLALDLHRTGVLDAYGIKLIGAQVEAIEKAEDRQLFKQAMEKIGLSVPLSGYAHSLEEAREIQARMAAETGVGYPVLLRPSFTLGGSGAAVVWNGGEFDSKVLWGLQQSPRGEVLVEQSVLGWKEYELEVMRDKARQRRHHLLDRKLRSDGRAHRRFDHDRARDDVDRQGVPDHARRGAGRDSRDRRRDGRVEHPVRDQPGERPDDRHRDEPARVAQLGAGVEGDRVPDREDRHQAGGRLHAGRGPQRHHARDAGVLRADHRLRRHQGAALRVREVRRRGRRAGPADEIGGRGDGDRAHVQGEPGQGPALAGDRPLGPGSRQRRRRSTT